MDGSQVYAAGRRRVIEMVRGTAPASLERGVPATPSWTVRDVLGHLAGVLADVRDGRMDGAPGDAWTARHVAERAALPVGAVIDEWARGDAGLAAQGPLPFDVVTHEHDLCGALDVAPRRDGEEVDWLLQRLVGGLHARLEKAGGPALRVRAGSDEWIVGRGQVAASGSTEPYELLRALMGRRSHDQVRAWLWEGDPTPFLSVLSIFPPPERDLAEGERSRR